MGFRFAADKFKKVRKEKAYSRRLLAKFLGVAPETVKLWEQGKDTPTNTQIEEISRMFGYPIWWFFEFKK